ncbi:class I SAM-dependent methyltransferase [Vulgatibacter incomptus]|uniref:Putative methyltransferase n=1 Tax=Vulgatibacter incomptus TaxID=1391653 RepID=A0A0K1PI09_9BACT|nr:class I SAM-dependent methyltransferase [Vulgatibacter incomptus]AKU92729.1 putative methyltransferase [Vulgatibacter incomptus]
MHDRPGTRLFARIPALERLEARLLAHGHAPYERAVEPWKQELFGQLSGDVLEIGAGAGANLELLPAAIRYSALEPNAFSRELLTRKAAELGRAATVVGGNAERLPFADESFDAVICSLVLCTIHHVPRALAEVRRVLRPEGRFVFVEHVIAPQRRWLRAVQHAVKPLWYVVGNGCRPDRDTAAAIAAAGFSRTELQHVRMPVPVVGPHLVGYAIR